MAKRHSQDASLSPESSTAGDTGDVVVGTSQKPSKRLKKADGSVAATASPTANTKALSQTAGADEDESEQDPRDDDLGAPDNIKSERDGSNTKTGASVGPEGEGDDDADDGAEAADMTVAYHEPHDTNDGPAATAISTAGFTTATSSKAGGNSNYKISDLIETLSTVSEDSDADVPIPRKGAYHHLTEDEINYHEPQVTVCAWDGCTTGDLGTMDHLVEHLHGEHVEGKQRRYTCEWVGCARKGKSHASAYALKAHLRSHTREKPHVCLLPECDQAFARQDALNKHMRTAHEIDLIRSMDTVMRSGSPWSSKTGSAWAVHGAHSTGTGSSAIGASAANGTTGSNGSTTNNGNGKGAGSSKLKIIIKTPQSHAAGKDDSIDYGSVQGQGNSGSVGSAPAATNYTFVNETGAVVTLLTREQGFSARELDMPIDKLYGLCQCQLRWAEEESQALRRECAAWEETYYQAWLEQQVLLDQVIQSEKGWQERRKTVLASLAVEEAEENKKRRAAAKTTVSAAAAAVASGAVREEADDLEEGEEEEEDDEDDDSAVDEENDNEDGDDDDDVTVPDMDTTQDDMSFADNTSFAHVGSSLRNEVLINGK